MIKFFRKIRQNMLTENKFSKYLLYAIGEIVLVIIGILIALSINEQSKNNENNKLRDLYIIQLNDEVEQNIKKLNNLINNSTNLLKKIESLRQFLANKEYRDPKFLTNSTSLFYTNKFTPTVITYENIKFSGDLKLFNDLNLRNSISETYDTFNYIDRVEIIDHSTVSIYYEKYFMPNAKFSNMAEASKNYGTDDYFENMVVGRSVSLRQNIDAYENTIEALKELKSTFAELKNDN
ncbi:MAG: DUF6090 family protein [Flavobacteriaceae bacterium]